METSKTYRRRAEAMARYARLAVLAVERDAYASLAAAYDRLARDAAEFEAREAAAMAAEAGAPSPATEL